MNFQTLSKIESHDVYLDWALRNARLKLDLLAKKTKKKALEKKRCLEKERVNIVRDSLQRYLKRIMSSYPKLDDLPEFYRELVKCTLDYRYLKKCLGAVSWANRKVDEFSRTYHSKIVKAEAIKFVDQLKRQYIGRISSVMKQIREELAYLEEARKVMKQYPTFKTSMKTVVIFGFPNVGKTTLLFKLTGSRPDIESYPFTTKMINVGYCNDVQIIDTPGTLDRFDKMNDIEKQAHLVLKYLADRIIYVFDMTEPYPMQDQLKLYRRIGTMEKPVLSYFSKQDIVDREKILEFVKQHGLKQVKLEQITSCEHTAS